VPRGKADCRGFRWDRKATGLNGQCVTFKSRHKLKAPAAVVATAVTPNLISGPLSSTTWGTWE